MENFLTYRRFTNEANLLEVQEIFNSNNIEYLVEDNGSLGWNLLGNNELNQIYFIKIKRSEFSKADKLLKANDLNKIQEVEKNHYLYEFSDEELLEIIEKPDEWSEFDFKIAQKILKSRGVELSENRILELEKERMNQLSAPETTHIGWIIFGYVSAFLGGLLGIFIGKYLLSFKKTLPDGKQIYVYNTCVRKHGQRIYIIGLICFIFWVSFKIINMIE